MQKKNTKVGKKRTCNFLIHTRTAVIGSHCFPPHLVGPKPMVRKGPNSQGRPKIAIFFLMCSISRIDSSVIGSAPLRTQRKNRGDQHKDSAKQRAINNHLYPSDTYYIWPWQRRSQPACNWGNEAGLGSDYQLPNPGFLSRTAECTLQRNCNKIWPRKALIFFPSFRALNTSGLSIHHQQFPKLCNGGRGGLFFPFFVSENKQESFSATS